MMWLEYLLDRIGGPEVFAAIFANKANAWSDPAVIEACTKIQDLVKANGFIKGFSSIAADTNADQALLYTGKAAMMLHGSWVYGSMKTDNPSFVSSSLEFGNFPAVSGGKGDPTNIVGNPANYFSISSKATDAEKAVAKAYFTDGLFTDTEVKAWTDGGRCRWRRRRHRSCPARPMRRSCSSSTTSCPRPPTSSSRGTRR